MKKTKPTDLFTRSHRELPPHLHRAMLKRAQAAEVAARPYLPKIRQLTEAFCKSGAKQRTETFRFDYSGIAEMPRIKFTPRPACKTCGADKPSFEFLIMDDKGGWRTARPEELMLYGFHVGGPSVDAVATLLAQQFSAWNGVNRFISGNERSRIAEMMESEVDAAETIGSSAAVCLPKVCRVVKKARRPKS